MMIEQSLDLKRLCSFAVILCGGTGSILRPETSLLDDISCDGIMDPAPSRGMTTPTR
jgi:hypothetical protein